MHCKPVRMQATAEHRKVHCYRSRRSVGASVGRPFIYGKKSVKDTKANDTIKPTRKVGRPCVYTPEALEVKFEEYANWTKNNPIIKQVPTKHGLVDLELQRPKTIVGVLCICGNTP